MADYVYVGRSRHRVRLAAYQILTLGIYGRVWMYKLLREIDGHEALFLDRRPYVPLLILPIGGPFIVKRRVARLVEQLVHHDVTGPAYDRTQAMLLALVPWAPAFHLYIQKVVNHHWRMHTKQEELELKRTQLAHLQRRKGAEAQAQAAGLAKEVAQRQKELEDLRSAALALREAEELRRRAERESGVRRSPLARVKQLGSLRFSRSKPEATTDEEGAERTEEEPATQESAIKPKARGRSASASEAAEPQEEPPAAPRRGLGRFFSRGAASRSEGGADDSPPEQELTKEQIQQMRQKVREERRAAKEAAKQQRRQAKQKRKEERKAAKEARRQEKLRLKEERRRAKDKEKDAPPGSRPAGDKAASRKKEKPAAAKRKKVTK